MMEKESRIEKKEKYNPTIEIGDFEDIKTVINICAIDKIINNKWGNENSEKVAQNIKELNLDLNQSIIESFNNIKNITHNNEELLIWIAFSVNKQDSIKEALINQAILYKKPKSDSIKELFFNMESFYNEFVSRVDFGSFSSNFIENDITKRKEDFNRLKKNIDEALFFFNPLNSKIKKVIYLPTNPLERKHSGNGINAGEVFYVLSTRGNEINEVHEFLHSFINSMVEKIKFSKEEENFILENSSSTLKDYQFPSSIFVEEIIRTYKDGFKAENEPNFENFKRRATEDEENKQKIKELMEKENYFSKNETSSIDSFLKEFYEKYKKEDIITKRIWKFFEEYKKSKIDSFEEYLLQNYKKILRD